MKAKKRRTFLREANHELRCAPQFLLYFNGLLCIGKGFLVVAESVVNLGSHAEDDGLSAWIVHLIGMFEGLQDDAFRFFCLITGHIDACQRVEARRDTVVVAALHLNLYALLGVVRSLFEIAETDVDAAQCVQAISLFGVRRAVLLQGFQCI